MFAEGQAVEDQVEGEGERSQVVHVAAVPSSVAQTAGSRIDSGRKIVESVGVM